MFNVTEIREVHVISHTDRQRICLIEDNGGMKYIKREFDEDKREIYKTLKKINHPSIPKIIHIGFDEKTTVVEEYIDAMPLSQFMDMGEKLDYKKVKHISLQVLSALKMLHSVNIIHRDIKPQNIMIDNNLNVWLTDFDIARILRCEQKKDTEVLGTFGYAPIEQFGMMPTDFKTDIYAFGVTLKELIDYASIKGNLYKVAQKCSKLDPNERYKDADEVIRAVLSKGKKIIGVIVFAFVIIACVMAAISGFGDNPAPDEDNQKEAVILSNQQKADDKEHTLEKSPEENVKYDTSSKIPEPKPDEAADFDGTFYGFEATERENSIKNCQNLQSAAIFAVSSSWEHLLMLDDAQKNGKIKLGEGNVADASISLSDGALKITLKDKGGKEFNHTFKFQNQYVYENTSTTDKLRKNADIICYDFDADGDMEILVGLNQCYFDVVGGTIISNPHYNIAWCIEYDKQKGFTLCGGEMFTDEDNFYTRFDSGKLNVYWEDFDETMWYSLENGTIKAH